MGLSRPGVESTLFRARKRLGEEYDELVSGQRCQRIQSIITAAGGSALGTRDTRRLARHISHCQPCRRMAVASGLDTAAMARKPVRRAIERAGAFLPLPGFLRSRLFAGTEQMVPASEPMAAAWSKAVAVAATVIVAGVGTGVVPNPVGGEPPALKQDKAKPAASKRAASPAESSSRARRPLSASQGTTVKSTSRSGGRNRASLGKSRRAAQRKAGGPTGSAPASSQTTPASQPAAVNPSGSTPSPTRGGKTPTGGGDSSTPRLPKVTLPSLDVGVSPTQAGGQVNQAVEDVTNAVTDTTGAVQDTVNDTTGGLPTP
jgi:hypothetical protein